jgi:hypothetical protein
MTTLTATEGILIITTDLPCWQPPTWEYYLRELGIGELTISNSPSYFYLLFIAKICQILIFFNLKK